MSKFRPLRPKARRHLQYDYEFRSRSVVDLQAEADDLLRRIFTIEIRPEVYVDFDNFSTSAFEYAQFITPALFSDTPDTFTAATVAVQDLTQTITEAVYVEAADTFTTSSLAMGEITLTASVYTEAADTFTTTVVSDAGVVNIVPALYDDSTDTFTASSLAMGEITITEAVYTEAADTFTASSVAVDAGEIFLTPSLYDESTDTFTASTVSVDGGDWWLDTDYDLLTSVMDFNEDRYALPAWGSELVTNGGFATDTGWTKATNATINNAGDGVLTHGPTVPQYGTTNQTVSVTAGKLYVVTYTLTRTAGSVQVHMLGTGQITRSTSGTYTEYLYSGGTQLFIENVTTNSNYTIDNISVREVILTPTGRTYGGELITNGTFTTDVSGWTVDAPAAIAHSSGRLQITGNSAAYANISSTAFATTIGDIYEISFDSIAGTYTGQLGVLSGSFAEYAYWTASTTQTIVFKFKATATSAVVSFRLNNAAATGTVFLDNVSVRKLTAIGVYPKREATWDECFAYAASSDSARTYTDSGGVLQTKQFDELSPVISDAFDDLTDWTVSTGGTLSLSGGAMRITATASTWPGARISLGVLPATTSYKLSIRYRTNTGAQLYIRVTDSPTGAAGAFNSGDISSASFTTYTNTFTTGVSAEQYVFLFENSGTANWLEVDDLLILRPGVNARRLTYANGKRQLRLENAGTNICQPSGNISTSWAGSNASVTANQPGAPDGTATSNIVTTTTNTAHWRRDITVTASTAYTFSFWAKRGTMTDLKYSAYNVTGSAEIVAPTSYYSQTSSSWTRISVSFTTPVGCTSVSVYVVRDSGVTGTVEIWGAQVEASAFATDYIPTTTGTVNRAIETARLSPLLEAVLQRAQGGVVIRADISNTNTGVGRRILGGATTTGHITANTNTAVIDGWSAAVATLGGGGSILNPFGLAWGFDVVGTSLLANAGTRAGGTTTPSVKTEWYIARGGTVDAGRQYSDGYYDFLGISPERLPDADLQALALATNVAPGVDLVLSTWSESSVTGPTSVASPNGDSSASRWVMDATTTNTFRIFKLGVGPDGTFYLAYKTSTIPFIHIRADVGGSKYGRCINTSTDALTTGYYDGTTSSSAPTSSQVTSLPNGWKRFQITQANMDGFFVYCSDSATTTTCTFTGTETVDYWDAKLD